MSTSSAACLAVASLLALTGCAAVKVKGLGGNLVWSTPKVREELQHQGQPRRQPLKGDSKETLIPVAQLETDPQPDSRCALTEFR